MTNLSTNLPGLADDLAAATQGRLDLDLRAADEMADVNETNIGHTTRQIETDLWLCERKLEQARRVEYHHDRAFFDDGFHGRATMTRIIAGYEATVGHLKDGIERGKIERQRIQRERENRQIERMCRTADRLERASAKRRLVAQRACCRSLPTIRVNRNTRARRVARTATKIAAKATADPDPSDSRPRISSSRGAWW